MAKPHRCGRGARQSGASSTNGNPSIDSSGDYKAPTAGYEGVLYAHGTTKAAALFVMVNTKLARYVSVQIWGRATIAGQAMEKLVEPTQIKHSRPSPTEELGNIERGQIPDRSKEDKSLNLTMKVRQSKAKHP